MSRSSDALRMGKGLSRRDFLKLCIMATATMGLPLSAAEKVMAAVEDKKRPRVVWLHFQECTGCSEALLRSTNPNLAALILDLISLDYHETLMAAAGHQAEAVLQETIEKHAGNFICVVEGSVPTKDNGIYCKIAGKKAIDILNEVVPKSKAVIAVGNCASFGGVQSAPPNPTGAKGVMDLIDTKKTPLINVPGCPPNPYNFLSTVLYVLTFKKIPKLDKFHRPTFAFGRTIHEHCERRPHFDAGRFAEKFGDEGHRQGWCLYKLGCKGPITGANCCTTRFNDVDVWPIGIGHPCEGCTEKGVAFFMGVRERVEDIHEVTPPSTYAPAVTERGKMSTTGVAAVSAALGAALGAGAVAAAKLPDKEASHEEAGKEA